MEQSVPIISVLLAIVFGIIGLILFISFITTISNSVRIDTILNDLHANTQKELGEEVGNEFMITQDPPEDLQDWQPLSSPSSGYFLTSLLDTYLHHRPQNCAVGDNGDALVWLTTRPLQEILFSLYSPLRTYCTGDVVVTRKIIYSLRQLQATKALSSSDRRLFRQEVQKIKKDFLKHSLNEADQKLISLI